MYSKKRKENDFDLSSNKKITFLANDNIHFNVPDEILFKIFQNLSIIERCKISIVCKKWLKICHDKDFWYNIDLSPYNISLKQLSKFLRHPCLKYSKSIAFSGNLKFS